MVRRTRKPVDPDAPIKAVIYTRLSKAKTGATKDHAARNTEVGLETQEAGCRRQVAALSGTVVAVESDVSAGDRLDNRSGLFAAIGAIESGEANTLIVYSLERLSRDQVQQSAVVAALRRAGGRLLSATENVEEGPLGDLMRAVYAFGGAYELAKTRERVNRSLTAKFKEAKRYKPAQRPPYGYRRIGSGEDAVYDIDPAESLIVRRIYSERAAGASVRSIVNGLRADAIPTPTGRGQWGTHSVMTILDRAVYWSGEHEVWRTQTVRDADGVPLMESRPAEDRYTVPFPPFVDPAIAARASRTAERNVWQSRRSDRPAEHGIGRYGFFRCGGCGRAMGVLKPPHGHPKYACTQRKHLSRPCPAPTSISVDKLDLPVWWWVQAVIENPANADAWVPVEQAPAVDEETVRALLEAENTVRELEERAATMTENLALVTGAAARLVVDKLNALSAELDDATARRDRLAHDAAGVAAPAVPVLVATDALSAATVQAIAAMRAADPNPERTHTLEITHPDGVHGEVVPDSWKAKRAAMATLGVSVMVNQEAADAPRWVAEMHIGDGVVIRGQHETGPRGHTMPHGYADSYLFPTSRCSG